MGIIKNGNLRHIKGFILVNHFKEPSQCLPGETEEKDVKYCSQNSQSLGQDLTGTSWIHSMSDNHYIMTSGSMMLYQLAVLCRMTVNDESWCGWKQTWSVLN
jgi:hypothetical protein